MTIDVSYARRPARTSQAEAPRPRRSRSINLPPPRVIEFGRWPRLHGIVRTIATLSRPGLPSCAAIAHWNGLKQAGLILIREEHVEIVRSAIAGTRACSPKRVDSGTLELSAGHTLRVWSCAGMLYLGKASASGRGLLTVLNRVEIDSLEKAIDELVRRRAR